MSQAHPQTDIRRSLAEIEKLAVEKPANKILLATKILSLVFAAQNPAQIIPDDALRVISQDSRRVMFGAYCKILLEALDT